MTTARWLFAFSVGMAAAINPCGFALLPAYLSYYLGLESTPDTANDTEHSSLPILRALKVSASMTAGFVIVFGIIGAAWSYVSDVVGSKLPWVTVGVGIVLVLVGIAMLFGYTPVVSGPKLKTSSGEQSAWSVFVFGITYAVASLSCTIGLFVSAVLQTFSQHNFFAGLSTLLAYALGMGAIISILTVAVTFARQGLITRMKRMLAHMGQISGILMIVSGLVAAYYGWYEAETLNGSNNVAGPGETFSRWQSSIAEHISTVGAGRIGIGIGLVIATALGLTYFRRRPNQPRAE